MQICFGLGLDGLNPALFETTLGQKTVGPLGFLSILETQLGIFTPDLSHTIRTIDYLACLRQVDTSTIFYHRSLAVDEFNVAAELLHWRDTWYAAGWDGSFPKGVPARLEAMAAVEVEARNRVAACIGQRLQKVLGLLENQSTQIDHIILRDPVERFSVLWQQLLSKFECVESVSTQLQASQESDLGKVQYALQQLVLGKSSKDSSGMVIKTQLSGDNSFVVVHANSRMVSAQLLARWLKQRRDNKQHKPTVLLSGSEGTELDDALEEADLARTGFSSSSPWRPLLQVLPLALDLLWDPLDPAVLLQFLMHPMGPLPRRFRQPLADIVSSSPGIGGQDWREKLHFLLQQKENHHLANDVKEWFESKRYPRNKGIPINVIKARTLKVHNWLERLLARETDDSKYFLIGVAYHQADELVSILDNFKSNGNTYLGQEQLRYLVEKLAHKGTAVIDKTAECLTNEANWILACDNPANCYQPQPSIIWWDFQFNRSTSTYSWSKRELQALTAAKVVLTDMNKEVIWQADNCLRPIFSAMQQLTLVIHHSDEGCHPLWDQIMSCVKDWQSVDAENAILTGFLSPWSDDMPQITRIDNHPLPAPQRWWQLASGEALGKREQESYSSLDRFIHSPYQWVLAYKAKLYPGTLKELNDGNMLKGTLVHHLYEQFFKQKSDSLISEELDLESVDSWFYWRMKALLAEEGAVLLQPGRSVEKTQFEETARRSLHQLIAQLRSAKITRVEVEHETEGYFNGGGLAGIIDMRVVNAQGQEALIDIKWGGEKYRRESLEKNTHLQLVLYAHLRQQQADQQSWPSVAYFIIDGALLLAQNNHYFPEAVVVRPNNEDNIAEVWQQMVATWKWRREQLDQGLIEITIETTEPDDNSHPKDGGLILPKSSDTFSDYGALTGWTEYQ